MTFNLFSVCKEFTVLSEKNIHLLLLITYITMQFVASCVIGNSQYFN